MTAEQGAQFPGSQSCVLDILEMCLGPQRAPQAWTWGLGVSPGAGSVGLGLGEVPAAVPHPPPQGHRGRERGEP